MNDHHNDRVLEHARIVYMIGIAGVGMTALAQVLKGWGKGVQGADVDDEFPTDAVLERVGIARYRGFDATQIPDVDCVITSSAYGKNNVEVEEVLRRGLPLLRYDEALAQVSHGRRVIAVTGTHGKTTTTAMIGLVLEEAGLDPTVIVGASVLDWRSNARVGHGEWMVVEADEYQEKFLSLEPEILVITSIDWDHPDYFRDPESYRESFCRRVQTLPRAARVIGFGDDVDVLEVLHDGQRPAITYGRRHHREIRIIEESHNADYQQFWVIEEGVGRIGPFRIGGPGAHMVSNATAAVATGIAVGVSVGAMRKALSAFQGTERRMQEIGSLPNGAIIVDDYAHHPVEVAASLAALCSRYNGKTINVVFQPHTFTRTQALLEEFSHAFGDADRVVITDIFGSAREQGGNIAAQDLAHAIEQYHHAVEVVGFEQLVMFIRQQARAGDVWILMGAGEGWKVARALVFGNVEHPPSAQKGIVKQLRALAGEDAVEENVALSTLTTFRIGGPARYLVHARSSQATVSVARFTKDHDIPLLLLSGGANMLVSDAGVNGVVLRCEDRSLIIEGARVVAGSGVPLLYLATQTAQQGLAGAEFCAAIPGAVGGAVRGNAGAFGSEIKDIVESVDIWDGGERRTLANADCAFRYRSSIIKVHNREHPEAPWIVLGVTLRLQNGSAEEGKDKIKELLGKKSSDQALEKPSAGCIFKNVPILGDFWADPAHARWRDRVPAAALGAGTIGAGWLIDQADLKGTTIGGAQVSNKHGNFIINTGRARAEDVVILISLIKQKVRVQFGVQLEEEVEIVGL